MDDDEECPNPWHIDYGDEQWCPTCGWCAWCGRFCDCPDIP